MTVRREATIRVIALIGGIVALLVAVLVAATILPNTNDLGYTDCTDGPFICLPPEVKVYLEAPAITLIALGVSGLIAIILSLCAPTTNDEKADDK
jgi:hypothetical protein